MIIPTTGVIMIDILERSLAHINLHRRDLNRITYYLVSSTQAGMYIRAMKRTVTP